MKDKHGNEIEIGCKVMLLDVQEHWFSYEPKDEAKKLQEACMRPLPVSDIYDGRVTVDLPASIAEDGEMVGNSITTTPEKLEVVEAHT